MKKFFSFIVRQSVAIILIVLLVLGFGVYSTFNMHINLLPDIKVPIVCVQVIYPGANAASVERDVTVKVEDGLSSLSGVTECQSMSYDNFSAVVLSFDYGIDTNQKKNDIRSKVSALDLPSGVSVSVYDLDLNGSALAEISVTSDKGLDDAYVKAKELAASFAAIDGVENVKIKGGAESEYTVSPIGGLEIICPLIVQAFSYGALDLPLGNIIDNGKDVQIRNNSDVKSVDDIKNMPVELPAELVELMYKMQCMIYAGIEATGREVTPQLISTILFNADMLENIKRQIEQYPAAAALNISNELVAFVLTANFPVTVSAEENGEVTVVAQPMAVKVKEIAKVESTKTYNSYAFYFDGKLSVAENEIIIEVFKSNGANSSAVVENVKKVYGEISSAQGYTAKINLLDDQSQFISESISNVLISMLIGGVLAILIIYLFLKKVRTSLVIAITMPLSVLAALICLSLMGITLNMVSLGGLAVGIGMLVDNSIVVIEAISKHREAGKSAHDAAVDGTCEVAGALFGSTLTTVCVFLPILFSGGLTAEIFTDLSYAVIFSLAFSLIVAVTVIPALYAMFDGKKLLRGGKVSKEPLKAEPIAIDIVTADEEFSQHTNENLPAVNTAAADGEEVKPARKNLFKQSIVINKLTSLYSKALGGVLAHKLITIALAIVIFASSIGLLFLTGTEFLPSIDKGKIEVNMTYGSGRELSAVQDDVLKFTNILTNELENIDYVSASVGKNGLLALTDTGLITVQLTTNRKTGRVVERIRELARENKDNIIGAVTVREIDGVLASLMTGTNDMSVTVMGDSGDTLKEIADKLKTRLAAEQFEDIKDSATDKSMQYTLDFDRDKLIEYGVDYQTVIMTLRIGIASYTACTVTIGGSDYNLNVRFNKDCIKDKTSLENFVIGFKPGGDIPEPLMLKDVLKNGEVKEELTSACIERYNGNNMITVSAVKPNVDTGTASKQMQKIAEEVLAEYNDYSFVNSGITPYLTDAFTGLAVALVVSFLLLYTVMAIQFASFVKPLIIMASIPFSFTGGFIFLVITRCSLNVVSFIGLIMLMGIIVNNAIVMLEKIKQLKDEGLPHYDAVCEACKVRLRPILMTTLTTILALIPLAIGIGSGSELMSPLGIVVIGGLLLGTLVTLALVPAVYCAVYGLSKSNPDGRRGKAKTE